MSIYICVYVYIYIYTYISNICQVGFANALTGLGKQALTSANVKPMGATTGEPKDAATPHVIPCYVVCTDGVFAREREREMREREREGAHMHPYFRHLHHPTIHTSMRHCIQSSRHPGMHVFRQPCVHAPMHPSIHASMYPCIYAWNKITTDQMTSEHRTRQR